MKRLVDLLYPPASTCLLCQDPRLADKKYCLCPSCREVLLNLRLRENLCSRCMTPLDDKGQCSFCKRGRMQGLRAAYGAFRHTGAARTLVTALKFDYKDEAIPALAAAMALAFPAYEYDALVPVPLHKYRQRMRGANQAELLCRAVGHLTGLPVLELLVRTKATRAQTKLDAGHRHMNMQGAFVMSGDAKGLRLLVVDDVRTTGATTRACAQVLTAAGAQYVGVLTATIAIRGEEEGA